MASSRVPKSSSTTGASAIALSTYSLNVYGSTASIKHFRELHSQDGLSPPKQPITKTLVMTCFLVVFGGSLPHGFNTGVINIPSAFIQEFVNSSMASMNGGVGMEPSSVKLWWSAIVAVYLLGGMLGSFIVGFIADRFGRKRATLLLHIPAFVASALFIISRYVNAFWMLIIARFIVGFSAGAGFCLVPLYLTEISPVNIRGSLGVLHQLAMTCGIFLSQMLGLSYILGTSTMWHILLALSCIPNFISLIFLPFMPDSPRYLLLLQPLERFRGKDSNFKVELRALHKEIDLDEDEIVTEWSFGQLFRSKQLRLPLLIVTGLAVCQQFSGINIVFYYSSSVFEGAGIPANYGQLVTLGIGFVNVLMTLISVPLMERFGRRILLLGGMMLMLISMAVIILALNLTPIVYFMRYVSCACIVTYVIGFAIGLGSIPQFIGAELFQAGPRARVMSIGGALNWTSNFIVAITYLKIHEALKSWSFMPFMACVLLFSIFIYFKLPETKNKTETEIQEQLNKRRKPSKKTVSSEDVEMQQSQSLIPNGEASAKRPNGKA